MKISVTQAHIDNGVAGSCTHDPIALAMKEAGLEKPWVGVTYLCWRVNHRDYFIRVPDSVLEFMKAFDNRRDAEPFEFEVDQ